MKNPRRMRDNRNIGHALSIVCAAEAYEHAIHADVSAWGAPGECHGLVSKGEPYRLRSARRHAEAVAGAHWRCIRHEAKRRIGGNALHRAEEKALDLAYARMCPFG